MTADEAASFEDFVTARWAALYRTAYLLTGNRADAEDVLQTMLVKAYTAWGRVTRADAPEAYLRRMLVNGFISAQRRHRRHREHLRSQGVPPPVADHQGDVLDRLGLWSHVVALPPRQTSDALRALRGRVGTVSDAEETLR